MRPTSQNFSSGLFGVTDSIEKLCYACLPVAFDKLLKNERGYSIVVVVSPLVAIMKDQVKSRMPV